MIPPIGTLTTAMSASIGGAGPVAGATGAAGGLGSLAGLAGAVNPIMGGLGIIQGISANKQAKAQAQAQQIAQQLEYDRAQFAGRMQVDVQNRAAYQANAKNYVNNLRIAEAALATKAINTQRAQMAYDAQKFNAGQQNRALLASITSTVTSRGLSGSSQTAKLMARQAKEQGLDTMIALANRNRLALEETNTVYKNTLAKRNFSKQEYTTFIPGSPPAPVQQPGSPLGGAIQGLTAGLKAAEGIQGMLA
tara:strand:+ start:1544 stop:2293 length:750 start_codon:yes stop_codon:yes gene_type:complete